MPRRRFGAGQLVWESAGIGEAEGTLTGFMAARLRRAGAVVGACGVVLAGITLAAAGPAGAQALTCGMTITASVTLTQNLDCSADATTSALVIGAAGLAVNLNGYQILGPGAAAKTAGIDDTGGHGGLTVENGGISDFLGGVVVQGTSSNVLTGIEIRKLTITTSAPQDNIGVFGEFLSGAGIHDLSIRNAGVGVELGDSQNSTISHNDLLSPETGLSDSSGSADTWSGNTLSGVTSNGITVESTTNVVIKSNTVTGRAGRGVRAQDATGSLISGNRLSRLLVGVALISDVNGTVSRNRGSGDGWGILSVEPSGAVYAGNRFSHGGYGIETDFPTSETLTGNVTNHNSEVGTYVYTKGGQTGFAATLSGNTGNDNQFGLYAQFPTAGTGNHATGNKVINCFNVTCMAAAAGRPGGTGARPPHHLPALAAPPASPHMGKAVPAARAGGCASSLLSLCAVRL